MSILSLFSLNPLCRRNQYIFLTSILSEQARRTESSLQKIRLGAQRRAGTSSDVSDNNVSDTDKICMQLFLDIQVSKHLTYLMRFFSLRSL